MKKTLIASTALVATAAAGTTVLVAAPASADVERRGTCAGATYELNVDRERGGFEVDADIDNARAGSEWTVAIRHDGKLATSRVLRADNEGELDLDTFRRNTAGQDTFRLTVTPAGGSACSVKVTLR
jgi:anti-sigma-K factor RskA